METGAVKIMKKKIGAPAPAAASVEKKKLSKVSEMCATKCGGKCNLLMACACETFPCAPAKSKSGWRGTVEMSRKLNDGKEMLCVFCLVVAKSGGVMLWVVRLYLKLSYFKVITVVQKVKSH